MIPQSDLSSDADDSDDEYDVKDRSLVIPRESIFQRIAALKDIVPPSTRRSLSHTFSTAYVYAAFGGKLAGKLAWVVTTSALLVGLPYALAVEGEAAVVQQERDFAQQQSGAQVGTGNWRQMIQEAKVTDSPFLAVLHRCSVVHQVKDSNSQANPSKGSSKAASVHLASKDPTASVALHYTSFLSCFLCIPVPRDFMYQKCLFLQLRLHNVSTHPLLSAALSGEEVVR